METLHLIDDQLDDAWKHRAGGAADVWRYQYVGEREEGVVLGEGLGVDHVEGEAQARAAAEERTIAGLLRLAARRYVEGKVSQ